LRSWEQLQAGRSEPIPGKETKDATDARQLASLVSQFEDCLRGYLPNREAIEKVVAESQKSVEMIARELIGHKLAGYYFLPSIGGLTENCSENGYVVLLREVPLGVRHPVDVARKPCLRWSALFTEKNSIFFGGEQDD